MGEPQRTDQLIEELCDGLEPVRRIPRLRVAAAGVGGLVMLCAVAVLSLLGLRGDLLEIVRSSAALDGVLLGLVLVGAGGVLAALAHGVPGRETATGTSLGLAALGMALVAGIGGVLLQGSASARPHAEDLACLSLAGLLALPPIGGILTFVVRGLPRRPLLVCLVATAGTLALGAILAHLVCTVSGSRHLALGHGAAPLVGAALLTGPLLVILRRFAVRGVGGRAQV